MRESAKQLSSELGLSYLTPEGVFRVAELERAYQLVDDVLVQFQRTEEGKKLTPAEHVGLGLAFLKQRNAELNNIDRQFRK